MPADRVPGFRQLCACAAEAGVTRRFARKTGVISAHTKKHVTCAVCSCYVHVPRRPHASRFDERNAPFVLRAAEMMGFHVIRVPAENAELHEIAGKLPLGKIFATGRAFVPFASRAAFDKLAVLVNGGVTSKPAQIPERSRFIPGQTCSRPKPSIPPTRCGRR